MCSYTYNQCTPPAAKLQIIEVIKWWVKWRKVIETGCNPYPNSAPFSSTQLFYFFQAIKPNVAARGIHVHVHAV